MVMKLDKVVPFGRSLDEYIKMFNLSAEDLQKDILGVGDSPASFNAEGTTKGFINFVLYFMSELTSDLYESRGLRTPAT
jgi:hypothetical protein